jgi:hypothetical protein
MDLTAKLDEIDSLHEGKQYKQVFELVSALYDTNKDNIEVLWRLARGYYDLSSG